MVKALGLTPCRQSADGKTLHQTRDNPPQFQGVPDAETLSPDERVSIIEILKWRLGIDSA